MNNTTKNSVKRVRLDVKGRVQGVGFRPHLYRRLTELNCAGSIQNTTEGVRIEVESINENINLITDNFTDFIPARARVDELEITELEPRYESGFKILNSSSEGRSLLPIPPDMAACDDCLNELHKSSDRRYHYAFNTCTCCGPRFTIATGIPFDRDTSVMSTFPLCEQCRDEFENRKDRRFHAQTMSCPQCGPQFQFFHVITGEGGEGAASPSLLRGDAAFSAAAEVLAQGGSLAVKGLGGFHIACDAANTRAVSNLRRAKRRPHKPFGLMARDMTVAESICMVTPEAGKELSSERAPIVLLPKQTTELVCDAVAPNRDSTGVMLPYTLLHTLLFSRPETPPVLVMTSCNRSDEPIAISSETVKDDLNDMVDGVLDHNRPITNRCDDSVVNIIGGEPVVLRRSRGYVPEPVLLPYDAPAIFAVGAMWKNTFTLTSGRRAYQSQYIGDVSDAENMDYFEDTFRKFSNLLRIKPQVIACDMHPDYPTTRIAEKLSEDRGLPLVRVQHHFAHICSCLAQTRETEPVIGVSMDGTGYGDDGHIWGGEFLTADLHGYTRQYHFQYMPMPGGDKAVTEPYRMALAYLTDVYGIDRAVDIMKEITGRTGLDNIAMLIDNHKFAPLTSSCGRLFGAVASLLGIRHLCTYEGQAACELEAVAAADETQVYPYSVVAGKRENSPEAPGCLSFRETIAGIVEDIRKNVGISVVSARFHNTVIKAIIDTCCTLRKNTGDRRVVLTGGVMQNKYLNERLLAGLNDCGFTVLRHQSVPANDGGIALGQAAHYNAVCKVKKNGQY